MARRKRYSRVIWARNSDGSYTNMGMGRPMDGPLKPEYCVTNIAYKDHKLDAIVGEQVDSQGRRWLLGKYHHLPIEKSVWELEWRFIRRELDAWEACKRHLESIERCADGKEGHINLIDIQNDMYKHEADPPTVGCNFENRAVTGGSRMCMVTAVRKAMAAKNVAAAAEDNKGADKKEDKDIEMTETNSNHDVEMTEASIKPDVGDSASTVDAPLTDEPHATSEDDPQVYEAARILMWLHDVDTGRYVQLMPPVGPDGEHPDHLLNPSYRRTKPYDYELPNYPEDDVDCAETLVKLKQGTRG